MISAGIPSKSVLALFEHLKRFPITSVPMAEKKLAFSFNTISNALSS